MNTVSNENKGRVAVLVDRHTGEALDLLMRAATLLHDTGVIDSERLDKAVSHVQDAIDNVVSFRENELDDHL